MDGTPAQIWEVNLAMRGVIVDQGMHQLVYRYRPLSVSLGAALSIVGVLATGAVVWFEKRNSIPVP